MQSADVASGSGFSENPVVSANGRYVAFESSAFNLVPNDQNGRKDVFVRDLQTGTTTLVSINSAGTRPGNEESRTPTISADGRFVAFESSASDLVVNDNNNTSDVFVRDLLTATTILVSINSAGTGPGNQFSSSPVISANGRVVVFSSFASNLVASDSNNAIDVFARDLQTSSTTLVSCNLAATDSANNASFLENVPKNKSPRSIITNDGRFIVFESNATNLVATSDPNGSGTDAFVRDLQTATTALVSINKLNTASSGGTAPVIAGNGRFVLFQSGANDLTANDTTLFGNDLFMRDLQANTTTLVSVTTTNTGSDFTQNSSYMPVVSDDGRFVAFESNSNKLVANDSNSNTDVFLRDMQTSTTMLVSVNTSGNTGANSVADTPVISADGRFIAFNGYGNDYVSQSDTNGLRDVYLRDMSAQTTTLLTINSAGTSAAVGGWPAISGDGRFAFFESASTDMVPNTMSGGDQVFAVAVNGRVQFDVTARTVDETAGNVSLAISRSGSSSGSVTVQYTTNSGTAGAGADFTTATGAVTFADGETNKTIVVPIVDDSIDEPNEALSITLSDFNASAGEAGSLSMAILNIVDDDPPPSISIDDIVVNEGNSGTSVAQFTLSLSNVSGKTISVSLAAANGTASSGSDYSVFANVATINPGNATGKVSVNIIGDTMFEDDETFFINLSNPINATLVDTQGMGTIKNDDPVPSITINDVTLAEGNGGTRLFNFSVRLSNPSSRQVTVQYSTADGTAIAPGDYSSRSGTVSFLAGSTLSTIFITVNGDTYVEPSETFSVNLANATDASLGDSQGVGTITNDDFPVLLTEQSSDRAITLDSVTWVRDPFSVMGLHNFSPDSRTRVSLFGTGLGLMPGETTAVFNVQAQDELGNSFTLPVDYLGVLPGVDSVWQLVVKLPDNLGNTQQLGVTVTLRGLASNRATIRIAP